MICTISILSSLISAHCFLWHFICIKYKHSYCNWSTSTSSFFCVQSGQSRVSVVTFRLTSIRSAPWMQRCFQEWRRCGRLRLGWKITWHVTVQGTRHLSRASFSEGHFTWADKVRFHDNTPAKPCAFLAALRCHLSKVLVVQGSSFANGNAS